MVTHKTRMDFVEGMKNLGFQLNQDGSFTLTNRNVAYDNDCSDDERDDEFYERWNIKFAKWAHPIIMNVFKLASKLSMPINVDTSAEYGMIDVEVK